MPFRRSGRVTHASNGAINGQCIREIQKITDIFLKFYIQNFSGRFDTSGSMIPLLVSEISALGGFCDEDEGEQDEEELGILVVGCILIHPKFGKIGRDYF